MEAPPEDTDMLLLLAAVQMRLGANESEIEPLLRKVLAREPQNEEALKLEASLASKIFPELVNALSNEIKSGGWYTCRNGHPFAIGECGGAMEVARCFCGAGIGGQNHRLLDDNQHHGAADGSQHPAYGEAANMQNYNLEDVPDDV